MGLFGQRDDSFYEKDFYEEIKADLKPKDENVHTIFINLGYEDVFHATLKKVDNYMNRKTEYIISKMQKEGYEIIDVKFSIGPQINRAQALIIYK